MTDTNKKRRSKNISLFCGTSFTPDADLSKPIMFLKPTGQRPNSDWQTFDIIMGKTLLGQLEYNPKALHYTLHWLCSGGNFCGSGQVPCPLDNDPANYLAGVTIGAHVFETLAREEREHIADQDE